MPSVTQKSRKIGRKFNLEQKLSKFFGCTRFRKPVNVEIWSPIPKT